MFLWFIYLKFNKTIPLSHGVSPQVSVSSYTEHHEATLTLSSAVQTKLTRVLTDIPTYQRRRMELELFSALL
jgi:hypothetical protein